MKTSKYNYLFALSTLIVFSSSFFISCEEKYDHTVDTANPTIVSFNPVSGVEDVAVKSNLVLTFDEYIKKAKGNIVLTSKSDTQTIDITSNAVNVGEDGRVVTIDPEDLAADEDYTVTFDMGIVTDLLDNQFMGIPQGTSWTFKTAGESGPKISALIPDDDSTDGSLFKLSMTFIAKIKKGEGNISIHTSDGTKVAEMSVASQSVVFTNNTLEINLETPLEFATDYYVNIDNGAIVDAESKKFKGFSDNSSWNFKTTAGSGNDLVIYLPMDEDLSDASGNKFNATLGINATAQVGFVVDATRGKVAQFSAGSYAVLPRHDLLRPSLSQNFSFNMWFKIKGVGSDPAIFSNKDWDSGGNPGMTLCTNGGDTYQPNGGGTGWQMNVAGDPKASGNRLDWKAGKTTPQAPALADDQWHMVSVVFDQANKVLHVYIDAVEYTEPGNAGSYDLNKLTGSLWDSANDYPFTIWEDGTGKYNSGSDTRKTLSGLMDDLRVYNKALTAEEVAALFAN